MKIKIILDNENYVSGYAEVGDLENSILISLQDEIYDEFINGYKYYKFVNDILIFDENKKVIGELELSSLNLEIKIMEKTKELELIKNSMFSGTQKEVYIQKEIDDLEQQYLDINHELALQIDKNFYLEKNESYGNYKEIY